MRIIEDEIVEAVNEFLGTFECNTNNIVKICHQRMLCIFRLRSFGVCPKTLQMLCLVCWFGTLSVKNRDKLNSIVNRGNKVVGVRQTGLNQPDESKRKGVEIMNDLCQILSEYYIILPPGKRRWAFGAKKAKAFSSFIYMSITFINKT